MSHLSQRNCINQQSNFGIFLRDAESKILARCTPRHRQWSAVYVLGDCPMGIVMHFPRAHARASRRLKPNTAGSASFPISLRAAEKTKNLSCEIFPRARQLLTADAPTPAKERASPSPPSAKMTSSTEHNMTLINSRFVNQSTVHIMPIVTSCEFRLNAGMARSLKDIAARLVLTEQALQVTAAELCRATGIAPNAWSQFKNPEKKRRITVDAAFKLKDQYGVTLEWLYDGDISSLPSRLANRIRRAA